jgi:hypothetical protein
VDPLPKGPLIMLFALVGILIGAVLGMRFRVFVLVPVITLVWIVLGALGFANGVRPLLVIADMLFAGATIQFGFLLGLMTRHFIVGMRAPPNRRRGTSRLPAAE